MKTLAPRTEEEVAETIRAALAQEMPVNIIGTGSRSGLGCPSIAELSVSTLGLNGVTLYEPSELVVTAHAGTPLATITEMLDEQGQELAFEPIDHGPLFGGSSGAGTIGGLVAVNASGPRRIKIGAARDHLLGFRAISGRGEIFQSGGRVMKNVTGYDMCKLMAGSYGTFGIFSEITIKVMPKAETELTLLVVGLDEQMATEVMTSISGRSYEVSGFAHLPPVGSGFSSPVPSSLADKSLTALRLEGPENSVNTRKNDLMKFLAEQGQPIEVLDNAASHSFWADLRDVSPFASTSDQVWRISTVPTEGAKLVKDLLSKSVPVTCHYYDWAGGLLWLALEPADDAHGDVIRETVDVYSGHATLIRASDEVRTNVPVFHPQAKPLAALTERLRHSFDPQMILNRGRVRGDL
jgi:glycolate dehydrogenase FAD-binding subunit